METTAVTATRLSPSEAEALWRRWKTRGDAAARDRLVLSYAPMVQYLATRKVRELPTHCELEDLVSCGLLALIETVDRFRPEKGATFEQYAWTRVSGAIIDELRRQDWASRSVRRTGRKVERARETLYGRIGRMPSEQELASELKMELAELRESLAEIERADVVSLHAPARGREDGQPVDLSETIEARTSEWDPERNALRSEHSRIVREAIAGLSERERQALALVYVHELPGAEIGRRFGVSESRVSQILSEARAKLRAAVERAERTPLRAAV